MFLSTYEKQLDGKRRLLIPNDFRTTENGAAGGVFIFPSIEADCLEAGGDRLFAVYAEMIESLPFGSAERSALEWQVMGEQVRLAYDSGGRITLPEGLCAEAGLEDTVVIVGLNDRFLLNHLHKSRYVGSRFFNAHNGHDCPSIFYRWVSAVFVT